MSVVTSIIINVSFCQAFVALNDCCNFMKYRGQFAIVRKCQEIKTEALYAAKIMRKRRVARGVAAADIGIFIIIRR